MMLLLAMALTAISGVAHPALSQPSDAAPAEAATDSLTLEWAYRAAASHFPRLREVGRQDEILGLRLANLGTRLLPSVSLNGQAVYHSEVASIPFSLPGTSAPSVPHDQYKVSLGVEQVVFGGGLVSGQKALEVSATQVATQEAVVAAYAVRERVEAAYFGVLLAEAQAASLELLHADLSARLEQVRVLVAQGAGSQSNADALQAERLRVEQQQAVAASRRRAALDALEVLTGQELGDGVALAESLPAPAESAQRPETELFQLTRDQLDRQAELAQRRRRPRVQAFGEAAYGQPPGLNLFEDSFKGFFSVGLRFTWSVWDWRTAQRDQTEARLRADIVTAREDAFDQQIRLAASQAAAEITQAEEMIARDAEIIALRERVAQDAGVRLENGIATATDYLMERNAAFQARLALDQHRIQLMQAQARYSTILGAR